MNDIRNYSIVTLAYWCFMLTDGALRMLTVLFFYDQGFSPVSLAFLFIFYEFFGILTNLFGGWLAQRFGLRFTLTKGLLLQVVALLSLSYLQADWENSIAIIYVLFCQALSGIAKDLTKMSSKTAIKFLIPPDQGTKLFKWVAILTGSKNAIKGAGFFVGGFLLQYCGYQQALWWLAGLVSMVYFLSQFSLPKEIGQAKNKSKLTGIFEQNDAIKILSAARLFLFGARDVWFVVAVPVFLAVSFSWSKSHIGAFMAIWVILYGITQAFAPKMLKYLTKGQAPDAKMAFRLALILVVCMTAIAICFTVHYHIKFVIVGGLYLFGMIFAFNSALHSYLVLDYSDGDKAAVNVGFYYMANATGRLVGTLFSGLMYQVGGVEACLYTSAAFLTIQLLITKKLTCLKQLQPTD
ncbi:MAG: organoarsenical effux MFS transporter ArsJ [Lentisphaeria bacterium]|nr:organoarsenical effux MFS transporter ArsJ [Lentisphaeria bacterium]